MPENIDFDSLDATPDPKKGPAWRQPHILDELINDRYYTYAEIANMVNSHPSTVGRWAREHGVSRGVEGGVYTEDTVPVGLASSESVEDWPERVSGDGQSAYFDFQIADNADEIKYLSSNREVRVVQDGEEQIVPTGDLQENQIVEAVGGRGPKTVFRCNSPEGQEFLLRIGPRTSDGDVEHTLPGETGPNPDWKTPDWWAVKQRSENVEIPLPPHISSEMDLSAAESNPDDTGDVVRFYIQLTDDEIEILLDATPAREGRKRQYANERTLFKRETNKHITMPLPLNLARILGLDQEGDSDTRWPPRVRESWLLHRDATYDVLSEDLARITFDPPLVPHYMPERRIAEIPTQGGERLTEVGEKTITPVYNEEAVKFWLEMPPRYPTAYGLKRGDSVYVGFGVLEDYPGEPAIIVYPDADDVDQTPGVSRNMILNPGVSPDSRTSDTASMDTLLFYVPKPLLNAMGLGYGEPGDIEIRMDLIPGEDYFALIPSQTQELHWPDVN